MVKRQSERLRHLVFHPPSGSKIEAARKHGIDLTLTLHNLELTPAERVREMENALRFAEALRNAERID